MFSGSTAGGLQSGPTTGRIDIIPDGGLPQTDVADLTVDLAHLAASLASKADSTNMDAALALKASNAEVDSALALKADAAATTAALAGKADISALDSKVSQAEFLEANTQRIQVDASLEVSVLNLANTKASTTDVNTALVLKADAAATTAALAGKADSSALGAKADASATTAALALKADAAATTAALDAKADAAATTSQLNAKQDIVVDSALQISHISGLQAALDSASSGEIADEELTIAKTQGLQSALDAKASTASMNTALLYKQNLIGTGSIGISATSGLQAALDSKGPALSDLAGTGSSFIYDQAQGIVRKIYGHGGVVVDQVLDLNDPSNPDNYQLRVDGSALQTALSSSSDVEVGSVAATLIKSYSGAALTLGNNAGTGIVVASSGAVGVLKTNPQEALDVYGNCAISGSLFADRVYANIYFVAASGADHAFCDSEGRSRLLLGSSINTFLYGCTMPSLTVGGTNVLTAITDLQSSSGVDSSTALHVSSLKATGAISSSSDSESVEVGRSGTAAMVRISSTYAALRLEGVGQSQNYTGFTITRNAISHVTSVLLGTVQYQTWASGSNTFHRQVVLSQPLLFDSGPKLQRANDNSLELYSGSNQAYKALTLQGSDGHVVAHIGFHNDSDETLKSDVVPASSVQALEVLKAVEPKVYSRNDLQDQSPRLGFIAQDFQIALSNTGWTNIVGATGAVGEHLDDQGNTVPAKPSTLTLDYARLVCCLWTANRSMLARLEALEARLP